ncbi:MAG TPA: hypothetical protein VJ719_12375, partial [Chthoniobacterales bacterium]|nr:hypothetical protein [Chthoniobacterales bacterium]
MVTVRKIGSDWVEGVDALAGAERFGPILVVCAAVLFGAGVAVVGTGVEAAVGAAADGLTGGTDTDSGGSV